MEYRELWEINPYIRTCVCTRTHSEWRLVNRIIYDHQFVLVSKGKGLIFVEERQYQVQKGDLLLILPGKLHGFIPDKEEPFDMEVVHFDFFYERDRNFWPHKKYHLKEGENVADIPDKEMMRDHPVFEKAIDFPEHMKLQNYTTVDILFKKLISMNTDVAVDKSLLKKSIFLELLYLICQENLKGTEEKEVDRFGEIRAALEYMNEHYKEDMRLEELAALCHLSVSYFSTLFKKQTTMSPKKYLMKIRLEKAKELLVQGDHSVTEICEETGFHDIHYFSQYFKCQEGCSPSGYRVMVKQKEL